MNYIYDILVNFNDTAYEFYDWNVEDEIDHIRKIALFRISSQAFMDLYHNRIILDNNLMGKIKNRCEVFNNKSVEYIPYACLFSSGTEVLGIEFNSSGKSIAKTKLLVDENSEVLEVVTRISETPIQYEIVSQEYHNDFKTRKEEEIEKYIHSEIRKLSKNNVEKLKYLYYECFNEKEENKEKVLKGLKEGLKTEWDRIYPQVYNFFKLTGVRK